ncbi:MAG TPA: hypothetical protein VGN42_25645 [Pirellulales bacterium]|nr:hypothetical protein [Pirellulales bacterium]
MTANPFQSPAEPSAARAPNDIAPRADGLREYILSAKNEAGKQITERVDAASADAAVETLRRRGLSEIVLHTDDVGAVYTQQSKIEQHISPKDYLGFRQPRGYLGRVAFVARNTYAPNWKWKLGILVVLTARRWMDSTWGAPDYLAIGILLAPLAWAFVSQVSTPVLRYHKFFELVAWGRWSEVLQESDRLQGRLPEREIRWQRAKALAGLGRLAEGLEFVAPLASDPDAPRWLYFSRLSDVYAAANDWEAALTSLEKASAIAPGNATILIDLAMSLLTRQRDLPRARQLLEQARAHALSDALAPAAAAVEGVLLLEEHKPDQARVKLEAGMAGLNKFRAASPLMGALLDRFRAYLALALAAVGDRAAAEREFRLAEPRLVALRRDELLARCRQAIAIAPTTA